MDCERSARLFCLCCPKSYIAGDFTVNRRALMPVEFRLHSCALTVAKNSINSFEFRIDRSTSSKDFERKIPFKQRGK